MCNLCVLFESVWYSKRRGSDEEVESSFGRRQPRVLEGSVVRIWVPRIGLGTTDRNFVTIPGSFLVFVSEFLLGHSWGTGSVRLRCGDLVHKYIFFETHCVKSCVYLPKVLFFLLIDGYSIDIEWFRPGKEISFGQTFWRKGKTHSFVTSPKLSLSKLVKINDLVKIE